MLHGTGHIASGAAGAGARGGRPVRDRLSRRGASGQRPFGRRDPTSGRSRSTIAVVGSDAVRGTMKNSLPRIGPCAAARSGLERRLDPRRQRRADPGHGGDLLDRRVADALDRAEHLEQLALALRPDAGQVVERRADAPSRPQVAVVGDREAVRLVAQALDEVERRRRRRAGRSGRPGRAGTAPRAPWPGRPAAGRAARARRGPPWRR